MLQVRLVHLLTTVHSNVNVPPGSAHSRTGFQTLTAQLGTHSAVSGAQFPGPEKQPAQNPGSYIMGKGERFCQLRWEGASVC